MSLRRAGTSLRASSLAASLLLLGLSACGGGSPSSTCSPVQSEPLDRRSLVHVLPGAATSRYLTDPPTSGPHQPSPPLSGLVDHPIDRPVQVGILEAGKVLVQYKAAGDAVPPGLADVAGPKVVVAPNPDLPSGTTVVATAWLTKLSCRRPDLAALQEFAEQYVGQGPGRP